MQIINVSGAVPGPTTYNQWGFNNSVTQGEVPGIMQCTTCAAVHGDPGISHLKKQIHNHGLSQQVCEMEQMKKIG